MLLILVEKYAIFKLFVKNKYLKVFDTYDNNYSNLKSVNKKFECYDENTDHLEYFSEYTYNSPLVI